MSCDNHLNTSAAMTDGQLRLEMFKRRYLQMEDPHEITFPPKELIKLPVTQRWMVETMFDRRNIKYLPTARYAFRVMKKLLSILEEAMEDPEEDVNIRCDTLIVPLSRL